MIRAYKLINIFRILNKNYLYFIFLFFILYLIITVLVYVESKWMTWFILGLSALSLSPIASRIFGNLEKCLLCCLVFSLQLQVGFNPTYREISKLSGVNGLNISLCFLIALSM